MGTRLGFLIRGNNDDEKYAPAISLYSNSHTTDAEQLMRKLADESIGPTELMMKIGQNNIEEVGGMEKYIFWADCSLEDTEQIFVIEFNYKTDEKVGYTMEATK